MFLILAPLCKLCLALVALATSPGDGLVSASQPTFELVGPHGRRLLSAADLVAYEWATHTLVLREGGAERLRSAVEGSLISGVPFALRVNGQVIYQGTFTTSLSSGTQSGVVIDLMPVEGAARDRLALALGYPTPAFFEGTDPRPDERVRQALEALHKLR